MQSANDKQSRDMGMQIGKDRKKPACWDLADRK
jgi:hypothetical protein